MAAFVNPQMTVDGLTLYLDAANPRSYPGTGTTWFDISGQNNHASIFGSTTFDSVNKAIDFGASTNSTNYVSAPNAIIDDIPSWTMEFIVQRDAANLLDPFISCGGANGGLLCLFPAPRLAFFNSNQIIQSADYPTTIGEPFHMIATGTGSTITSYKNNVQIGTINQTAQINVLSNVGVIFGQELDNNDTLGFSPTQAWLGKLFVIRIYNKILSEEERTVNYIGMKDRFNFYKLCQDNFQ